MLSFLLTSAYHEMIWMNCMIVMNRFGLSCRTLYMETVHSVYCTTCAAVDMN